MSNALNDFASWLNGFLWSPWLVYMAIGVGVFLSIGLRFPQFRMVKDMVRQLRSGSSSKEGVSSFQGFAMALGGRVGTGNIAGVASAIGVGGPGAVFWMWVIALVGAGSAFSESTLAQTYKTKVIGEYRGGPAYYIEKGLGLKPLAIVFALATILAMTVTGPTIQANAISTAFKGLAGDLGMSGALKDNLPVIIGAVVAALFLIVTIGGIKRIGTFAAYVVPIMSGIYLLLAIIILVVNVSNIPAMFALIFKSAFNLEAAFGAVFGATIMQGVKRGIYSNEAGWGSGAHAAATAEVSHPVKQGLAQSFSVYIDTLLVCTATALMLLSTGMYNVATETAVVYEGLPGVEAGPQFVQESINSLIGGFGGPFIAFAMFFFAFTTLLSFAVYADANIQYMLSKASDKSKRIAYYIGCIVIAALAFFASFKDMNTAWNYADVGVGICCWLNFPILVAMSFKSFKLLKDYEKQKKMGLDPVFVPEDMGLKNCEVWDEIVDEHYADQKKAKKKAMGNSRE